MRFLHGKVKANKGGVIRVHIDRPTRVLIMTSRHFKRYQNNQTFTYYGGQKEGVYEFKVPTSTTWHVVVEKGSYANPIDIKSRIEVEKPEPSQARRKIATSFDDADAALDADQQAAAVEEDAASEKEDG